MWEDFGSADANLPIIDWAGVVQTTCGKSVRILAIDAKDIERTLVGVCLIDVGRAELLGKFDLVDGSVLSTFFRLVNAPLSS